VPPPDLPCHFCSQFLLSSVYLIPLHLTLACRLCRHPRMSSKAKQHWQAILKHLQHLQDVVAAGGTSHTNTRLAVQLGLLVTLNGCIEEGPRFSVATWQAMIHKEQVRGYNPSFSSLAGW